MERRYAMRYEEMMADAEVKPEALEGILERLGEFVQPFTASLTHIAQCEHVEEYLAGLVSNVKRKTIETIAYLHEQDRQPLQKFIGQNPWDHRPLIGELARQIGAALGQAKSACIWAMSPARNTPWSICGCTCPRNGRRINSDASGQEYQRRFAFAHVTN